MLVYRRPMLGSPQMATIPRHTVASEPQQSNSTCSEDVLDQLEFLLALVEDPATSVGALGKLLVFLAPRETRLCLRARGALPRLLANIVALKTMPTSCAEAHFESRLLRAGLLYTLALDEANHETLVLAALPVLLEECEAASSKPQGIIRVSGTSNTEFEGSIRESGDRQFLKRRRSCSRTFSKFQLANEPQTRTSVFATLQHLSSEPDFTANEDLMPDTLALLTLRRCLRGHATSYLASTGAKAGAILDCILPRFESEATMLLGGPSQLREEASRLLLVLDVLEASIATCADKALSGQRVSVSTRPLGVLSWKLLSAYLDLCEAPPSCSTEARLDPTSLHDIAELVLRILHVLTHHSDEWGRCVLEDITPADEHTVSTSLRDRAWMHRSPSIFTLFVRMLRTPQTGSAHGLAVGILTAVASHGNGARRFIASFRVPSGTVEQLLKCVVPLEGVVDNPHPADSLLEVLSEALAVRSKQLFCIGDAAAPGVDSTSLGQTKSRVNCAVMAMLLGSVMHGDRAARSEAVRRIGSAEVIVDILRQFAVFQDSCGVLTGSSLLSLHAVMLSVAGGEDPETPLKGPEHSSTAELAPPAVTPPPRSLGTSTGEFGEWSSMKAATTCYTRRVAKRCV